MTDAPGTEEINSEDYITELHAALKRHGLGPEKLEFADEVDNPNSPLRVATSIKIHGRILLKRRIPRAQQEAFIEAFRKFDERAPMMEDPLIFLRQAVMHEACHLLWRYKSCDECDVWAFYEMKF